MDGYIAILRQWKMPWVLLEWDQGKDELRPEGLVTGFQYRLSDHLLHLELDKVWRENGMACGALEAVAVREDPSVSSIPILEADPDCRGRRRFRSDIDTRWAVFGAQFVGLMPRESGTNGNH